MPTGSSAVEPVPAADDAAPPSAASTIPLPLDVRLEVSQGTPEYPLVLGKDTLVRIVPAAPNWNSTHSRAIITRVKLEIRGEQGQMTTLHKKWDARHAEASFFVPGHLLWPEDDAPTHRYRFTVHLFHGDRFLAQASTTAHFMHNVDLRLLLVPMAEPLKPAAFRELAHGLAIASRDFPIRAGLGPLMPGVSAGLRYRVSPPLTVPARFRDVAGRLRCDGPTLLWLARQLLLTQAVYNFGASPETQADHVIGLVQVGQISPTCPVHGLAMHRGLYSWITLLPGHAGKALAMEIGHNLGIVSPLAANYNRAHPYHSRNRVWSSPGLVDLMNLQPLARAASVMFPGIIGSDADTLFEPDDYAFLNGVLHQRYLAMRRQDVDRSTQQLMLVGTIDPEGRPEDLVGMPLPSTTPGRPSLGTDYRLVFLDDTGATLGQVGIMMNFEQWQALSPGAARSLFTVAYPLPPKTTQAQFRQANRVLATLHPGPHAPRVTLPSPPVRSSDGNISIPVQASDPDGDPVRYHLAYSVDGGQTFIPVIVDQAGPAVLWPESLAGPERRILVRIVASDGLHAAEAVRSMRLPVGDPTPLAAIARPVDGQPLPLDTPLVLQAATYSPPGLNLVATWFVDGKPAAFQGASGTILTGLPPGRHQITLVVSDSVGRQAQDATITLHVARQAPPPP